MFAAAKYRPYSGVSFSWSDESTLTASCPWLSMDIDVEADKIAELQNVTRSLQTAPPSLDSDEVQGFLKFFADFPLLHITPRGISNADVLPYVSKAPEIIAAAGPLDFLESINRFEHISVREALPYVPAEWEWSVDEICDASAIPGSDLYDPFSVYTALRQRRLGYQIQCSHNAQRLLSRLEEIRTTDESTFFKMMAVILSQQYYVTRECCSCLNPAMENHTIISNEIRAYMNEELHHDRLILKSIKKISEVPPEDFYFAPEVQLEIEVIKYSSTACALGFSALVSIMEGTVYPESDPVGDILLRSSKPDSHVGVEAHFQINRGSNHTAIPETFVSQIPPVTRDTVLAATRLTEVTIRLDTGLAITMNNYLTKLLST